MKKFIFGVVAFIGSLIMSSCNVETNGVLYNLTVEGQANGEVSYVVPSVEGRFTAAGDLFLRCANDLDLSESYVPLGAGLESEQVDIVEAASEVDGWLKSAFSFNGDYHVRVHGYVKYMSITFEINEEYPKATEEVVEAVE